MKFLGACLGSLLLINLMLAILHSGNVMPLLIGLAGGALLLGTTILTPRLIHLNGFVLSAVLLAFWWAELRTAGLMAWLFAGTMAIHFFAISICIAQNKHPDDQRLRTDTNWVFGLAFFMTFIPLYLLFSDFITIEIPWGATALSGIILTLNFLILEFSRPINMNRPWMKTPGRLMRSTLFILLIGFILSFAFVAASMISQRVPAMVEVVRNTANDLRAKFQQSKNKGQSEEQNNQANAGTLESRKSLGLSGCSLGPGPGTNGANHQVMVVQFDPGDLQRLGKQRLYIRTRADETFLGSIWIHNRRTRNTIPDISDGRGDGRVVLGHGPNPAVRHTVTLTEHVPPAVHALPGLTEVIAPVILQEGDDWYRFPSPAPQQYTVVSRPTFYRDIRTLPLDIPAGIDPAFLELPSNNEMRGILRETRRIPTGGNTVTEIVDAYQGYLRQNFTYTLEMPDPGNKTRLEHFFLESREGYCTYFATAFALMLRDAGIPTRVAIGYAGGDIEPGSPLVSFRQRHAHAWTEILLADFGWVTVDATPPNYNANHQDATQQPEEATPDLAAAPTGSRWQLPPNALPLALLILSGLGLLLLFLPGLRNRPKRVLTLPTPGFFKLFCRTFQKHGHPKRPGQTLIEYLDELRKAGLANREFDPMSDYYYGVMYQDQSRDPALEKEFARQIKRYRPPKKDA